MDNTANHRSSLKQSPPPPAEGKNLSAYLLLNKANTNPQKLKKVIVNMIKYEFEFMDNL
jgi:hypothetical protein